jgi:hypothetical protein
MTTMTNGCKWVVGAAVSIWFAVAGSAQAGVFILDNPYNPGEQVVVTFKGCPGAEAQLEKLLPLLKQRQTPVSSIALAPASAPAAGASPVRVALASPVHVARFTPPTMIGVGF